MQTIAPPVPFPVFKSEGEPGNLGWVDIIGCQPSSADGKAELAGQLGKVNPTHVTDRQPHPVRRSVKCRLNIAYRAPE